MDSCMQGAESAGRVPALASAALPVRVWLSTSFWGCYKSTTLKKLLKTRWKWMPRWPGTPLCLTWPFSFRSQVRPLSVPSLSLSSLGILFPDHQLMAFTSLRVCTTFWPLKQSLSVFEICKSIRKAHKTTWPAPFAEYGGIFSIVLI